MNESISEKLQQEAYDIKVKLKESEIEFRRKIQDRIISCIDENNLDKATFLKNLLDSSKLLDHEFSLNETMRNSPLENSISYMKPEKTDTLNTSLPAAVHSKIEAFDNESLETNTSCLEFDKENISSTTKKRMEPKKNIAKRPSFTDPDNNYEEGDIIYKHMICANNVLNNPKMTILYEKYCSNINCLKTSINHCHLIVRHDSSLKKIPCLRKIKNPKSSIIRLLTRIK